MVARHLAKVDVAGSNPVFRSILHFVEILQNKQMQISFAEIAQW